MKKIGEKAKQILSALLPVIASFFVKAGKKTSRLLSSAPRTFANLSKSALTFSKHFPKVTATILSAVVIVSIGSVSLVMTGATVAYEVKYNGKVIGWVAKPEVGSTAKALASKMVCDENGVCTIPNLQYSSVLTGSSKLIKADKLALAILNNSKNLKKSAVLLVDGQVVAYQQTRTELNTVIRNYLQNLKLQNGAADVKLCDNVSIKEAYYPISVLNSAGTLSNLLTVNQSVIPVKTVISKIETQTIPYTTVETKSDNYTVGTKKVTKQGENGLANVIVNVSYVNGVEVTKDVMGTTIIKEPVAEQVTLGNKEVTQAVTRKSSPQVNTNFVWPLEKVSGAYVSAYYGDNRGHKGVDIASPSGTKILAVEAGTVVFSGWDTSGFGYCVIIDHGNGIQTLYAHCSQLIAKVGDVVGQGENIALVGCTGSATGNHLHFEVHINGSRVDPAPYIGA